MDTPVPARLLELLQSYPSAPEAFSSLAEALDSAPSVGLRLNPAKTQGAPSLPDGVEAEPVEWCPSGYYLSFRPPFTFCPELHQGAWYVQDPSSMFLGHVLNHVLTRLLDPSEPVRYLDACAAPGGKTTLALSLLPSGSVLVANEYDPRRAGILRENLAKWGRPDYVVTQGDTARFRQMPAQFDIIAADVPCSGEGMMRKDEEARAQWTPSLVSQCADRQREILSNLWPALRPGGYLVYSTCTFNRAENEEILLWLREQYGAESVEIPVSPDWNITPAIAAPGIHACRFIPGRTRGEGLFMALMRKPADSEPSGGDSRRQKPAKPAKQKGAKPAAKLKIPPEAARMLSFDAPIEADAEGNLYAPVPNAFPQFPLQPRLLIGQLKGRDIIPSQQLALSSALRPDAFPRVEISRADAIEYLRCQAITLPSDTPRGLVLLTYGSLPLCFVKNLGSRANNLYPKPWRILSQPPK